VEWLTLDAQGEAVTLAPEELGATAYAGAPTWSRWETAPGRCRCVAVRETPYWVQALWEVPGFGRVWLTADRDGDGWSEEGGPLVLLPLAFARTQLRRAQARAAQLVQQGEAAPLQAQERLTSAARVLEQAETASTPAEQARAAHAALADALWAGEGIVLAQAQRALARMAQERRARLRLGCQAFRLAQMPAEQRALFFDLFTAVTLPFYRATLEPEEGRLDWTPRDRLLDVLAGAPRPVMAKGHPLIWLHRAGLPAWMAGLPYERLVPVLRRQIRETVERYRGRIRVWDIINEAHHLTDGGRHPHSANIPNLTREQLLDLTALAAIEVGAADPQAVRVINMNDPFRRTRARIERPEAETWDGEAYLADVIARGIPFEVIGVQWYTGAGREYCRDFLTVAEQLERYCALARRAGKVVHITEAQVPSADQPDPQSVVYRWAVEAGRPALAPSATAGWWHRPWDKEVQADWAEAFYTLCLAQPEVEVVTWWDFADPGFWPWGGMLDRAGAPKPIYYRLRALAAKIWAEAGS
jgi:GH35 family endo-1,4-beta-xylanase